MDLQSVDIPKAVRCCTNVDLTNARNNIQPELVF
jgi:hypothetical protein